jgi:hypothetical protein
MQSSMHSRRKLCRVGVGVVAGGLMFVGPAKAAPLVDESFESNPSSIFGTFSSYAYNQNYTSANIPPAAGDNYYTGTPGQAQSTLTKNLVITDPNANGVAVSKIDAGMGLYNLSAWFSTYKDQNDWSAVRVQFKNASGGPLGTGVQVGGADFVAKLGIAPNADGQDGYRDWSQDSIGGTIPPLARSADVTIMTQRLVGNAADGYLDLINLDLSTSAARIPGDANNDGKVNFADLLILAQNYGKSPGQTFDTADFNNDGGVGFDDLLILAQNYGFGTGTVATPVPEPASVSMLALAAGAIGARRRRRQ